MKKQKSTTNLMYTKRNHLLAFLIAVLSSITGLSQTPTVPAGFNIRVHATGGLLAGQHLYGIAADRNNGNIYIAASTIAPPSAIITSFNLYKILPGGAVSLIGNYGIQQYEIIQMVCGVDGKLYLQNLNSNKIMSIDPSTGTAAIYANSPGGYRYDINLDPSGNLIIGYESMFSFYKIQAGTNALPLGNVTASVPNGNHGDAFGIQPNGNYIVYVDCGGQNNYSINTAGHVNGTNYTSLAWTGSSNLFTAPFYGSACGYSNGCIDPVTGDVYSNVANFGNGNSRIVFTPANGGASTLFVTNAGNGAVPGVGITDMVFGKSTVGGCTNSLFFTDRYNNKVYEVYQTCGAPPTVTCPANVTVNNDPGDCGAIVTYPNATVTGNPAPTVGYSHPSGSLFPKGTTTVTVTANNGIGTEASCTFTVTVNDNEVPTFTCPGNQNINLNGTCQLVVPNLVSGLTGTDNCGTVTFTQSPVAGSTLASAHNQTHNVIITANDGNGNTSQCTVVLTGKDLTAPSFNCPANQNVNLNGSCQLIVPSVITGLTGSDNCGTATFTQSPIAGTSLPSSHNQTHNVVITVNDGNGNTAQCTVVLTGKDVTPPAIDCPDNITVSNDEGLCTAVVNYTAPVVTDNCVLPVNSGSVTFNYTGSMQMFTVPPGVTSIIVDAQGGKGGNGSGAYSGGSGGLGGRVQATLTVIPGSVLNIFVGGTPSPFNTAGYNGGGTGAVGSSLQGGGGGGATDIRLNGTSLADRIIVAGGGGGSSQGEGGYGGGLVGGVGSNNGSASVATGGTQTTGGLGGAYYLGFCAPGAFAPNGAFGIGGNGILGTGACNIYGGGGGGGGWYGGGGMQINGAGGGSSYAIASATGVVHTSNYRSGNGVLTITYNSGPEIIQTAGLPSGSLFPVGTTTNTFETTDAAGNTSSCSFTVTVNDNEDPTFTCPANQNVNLNGSCQLIVPNLITGLTGSDNCGTVTFTQSPVAGTVLPSTHNQTHNVVITANDGNGNTSQCTVVLTGKDVTQPTFTCPANQNVNLNGTCQLIVPNLITGLTGNDNCGTVTFTQSPVAGSVVPSSHNQTHNVVITANDGNGNTSQCTVQLTGKDITQPSFTCPADQDVNLNGTCQLIVPSLVTGLSGSDNCGTTTYTQSPVAGTALPSAHNQTHNIVITANDGNGNTSQCTVVLTGKDVTQPVFTNCPSDITVSAATGLCSQVVNYTVTATDNCSAGTSASVNTLTGDVTNTDFNNAVSGLYIPSVTATKLTFTTNGFAHSHGAIISVYVDIHNPTTNAWTQVFAQQINGGGQFNFSGLQINFASQPVDQVRLRSSVAQNQTYHGWDGTTLTLTSPGVTIVPSHPSGSSFPVGTTTVTHTATDIAGNSATCTFTVTVTDDEKPTVTAPNTADLECSSDLPAAATTITGFLALPGATATDNCTPQANLLVSSSDGPLVNGNCNGSITRTYSITDAAGNTRNTDQVFTVTDNTNPTATAPNTVDLECSSDLPAPATTIAQFLALPGAAAGDNCTAQSALQVSSSDGPLVNGNCNGSITRTYTITDACGNFKSVDQVFTVTDNTQPTITAPNTVDIECSSDLPAAATTITEFLALTGAAANDNCTAQASLLVSSSDGPLVNGNCNGTITRTYTITDACGNTKSANQLFTVTDNTNPTITAPNTVDIECSSDLPAAAATITQFLALTGAAANDNCTAQSALLVSSSDGPLVNGNCNGTITRTYTITDACGNTKSANQVFTVTDNTIPVITTCPGNGTTFIRNTNPGMCTYKITNTNFDAIGSDNCTGVTMSYSIANEHSSTLVTGTGSLTNVYLNFGLNTITWKATDGCGNESAVCVVKVDVDKITTTSTLTVEPASQQYSDLVTFTATVTPYNCTGAGNIGGTVTFKIGSLVIGQAEVINGVAQLTDTLIEDMLYDDEPNNPMNPTNGPLKPGAKTVTAYFSGTDADYIVTNPTAPLTVTCENADFTYNGQTYFSVSPNTNTGTVVLSNYVVDRNDVPTGARGDIRNATATFWQNAINGTVLGTANIPVGLVNPGNYQEGFVTTSFTDGLSTQDISNGGKVYEVWSGLNNYYCGNSETYTPVTLGLPGQDFVTGGGYIVFGNNSAGTYAGTAGKRMNFGFVMKWNSSGKNLQGRVNVVYRKMVNGVQRIYQIKSNAINSLVVENVNDAGAPATGTNIRFRRATISTKANLADITDPLNPISLGGNLSLTLIGWESTTVTTGALDRISVQLSGSGSIGLLFSSNWSSGQTVHQTLNGGKIQVRNPNSPPPGQRAIVAPELVKEEMPNDLLLKAYPNPSSDYFILDVKGNMTDIVNITVYNTSGIKVHETRGPANRNYTFGKGWINGSYFVQVQQGSQQKTVQLVKQ